jgi:hypothetical protein
MVYWVASTFGKINFTFCGTDTHNVETLHVTSLQDLIINRPVETP